MRIGLIIYGSLDTLTGGYLYDRIVLEGLARLGHEVEVISLPAVSYLRRLWHNFSPKLCRRLLAGKFDVLIQDELCHPSLVLVNRQLRRQRGRPLLVALVHHILSDEPRPLWQNKMLAMAERRFLTSVDGFIHNSATTRQKVAHLAHRNLPQVIAYPAGDRLGSPLEPEVIAQRAQLSGPLKLLFLGNILPRKGLLPLLHALAGIDRRLWQLSIVGSLDFDPNYTRKVRRLVDKLSLSEAVRFLGPLHDDKLKDKLKTSHIFCMPYAYEGFGIAILEAMAFGLPAVGSRSGAAGETIDHGVNGFLLAPDDHRGLLPLLLHLHQDRQELLRLALAARATFISHPSWQDGLVAINTFLLRMKELPQVTVHE